MKYSVPQMLAAVVSLMVTAAVVAGFIVAGSPTTERARRFDDQRETALRQIIDSIGAYAEKREAVPATIADLQTAASKNIGIYLSDVNDPVTREPYEYQPTSTLTFRICATFQTAPRPKNENEAQYYPVMKSAGGTDFTKRTAGRYCWDIDLTEQVRDANAAKTVAPQPVKAP
jgi:hypothetical protein